MPFASKKVSNAFRAINKYLQCAEKVLHYITAIKSECKLKNHSGFDSKLLNLLENKYRLGFRPVYQIWSETNPGVTSTGTVYFLTGRQAQIFFPTCAEVAA